MPIRRHLAPLVVLLLTAGAGCGGGAPPDTAAPPTTTAQHHGDSDTPAGAGGFSTTDLAWLQLAIAMDERILTVLALVPDRAADPDVAALTGRLAVAHQSSLTRLRALRDSSGSTTANPHEGHDMPGMATSAQLNALRRATGRAAVDIFAEAICAHLDQSLRLARAERDHGTEPATRAAATDIERSRTEQRAWVDPVCAGGVP